MRAIESGQPPLGNPTREEAIEQVKSLSRRIEMLEWELKFSEQRRAQQSRASARRELRFSELRVAFESLAERLAKRDREIERWAEAEHALSSAYLRLRQILDAFHTPDAPTREEVWEHTEQRAREIVAERDQLRQQLARYEQMGAGRA